MISDWLKSLPWYVYGTWFFWALVLYVALFSNNRNSLILDYKVKKNITYAFPQGWGFFTRSPREALVDIYREEKGKLKLVSILNTSPNNFFGFSRNSRVIGFEMAPILKSISKSSWENRKGDFEANIPDQISDTINLAKPLKYFPAGTYVLHQYKIIPFAWVGQGQEKHRPILVSKIYVTYDPVNTKKQFNQLGQN
jgi:antimicrobial peptide system SdpA family protein